MKKISFLLVICILFTSVCNISFAKDVEREVYAKWDFKSGTRDGFSSYDITTDGSKYYLTQPNTISGNTTSSLAGDANWNNYSYECEITPLNLSKGGVYMMARATDAGNNYSVGISSTQISLGMRKDWSNKSLGSYKFAFQTGTSYKVRMNLNGSKITVYLNDELVINTTDSTHQKGRIGFWTWQAAIKATNIVVSSPDNLIDVEGMYLDKNNVTTYVGGKVTLTPEILPSNASIKNVNYKSSDAKVASVSYNGEITGISKGNAVITATTSDGGFTESCYVEVKENIGFTDFENHWAKEDIEYVAANGIFKGMPDGSFGVDKTITRAEFITAVARTIGAANNGYKNIFADVTENDWYSNAVQIAYDYKLIDDNMMLNKLFEPLKEVTREESATILARVYSVKNSLIPKESDINVFYDINEVSSHLLEDVKKAHSLGIIEGSDNLLNPVDSITRSQAAAMIARTVRLFDLNEQVFLDGIISSRKSLNKISAFLDKYDKNADKQPYELKTTRFLGEVYMHLITEDIKYKRLALARREISSLSDLLDDAVEDIENGDYYVYAEKNVVDGTNIKNSMFYNGKGEPIFLRGIIWENKLLTGGYIPQSIIDKYGDERGVNKSFQHNISSGWSPIPSETLMEKDWFYNNPLVFEHPSLPKDYEKKRASYNNNILNDILMQAQDVPQWLVDEDPSILASGNHYMSFDPDHPMMQDVLSKNFDWAFDYFKDAGNVFTMDMHNEPGMDSMTAYSFAKFQKQLEERYKDIKSLNSKWGTEYSSFTQINDVKVIEELAKNNEYVMGDYKRFKMDRFSNYFAFIKNHIQNNKDKLDVKTHIKLMDNTYTVCDIEKLAEIQDILGCDSYMGSKPVAEDDIGKYCLDWVNMMFYFDLYKSFQPDKAIYDAEWHAIDTVTYKDPNISKGYTSLALRLATWHGLAGTTCWYFNRPDVHSSASVDECMFQQPYVVNEFVTESIRIDNEMERITPFVYNDKNIFVLFSRESVCHQDTSYNKELRTVYENLYFNDVPVSFISERMLQDDKIMSEKDIDILVVPNVKYMPESAIDGLKKLIDKGVPVITVGSSSIEDEFGAKHTIKGVAHFELANDYRDVLTPYVLDVIERDYYIENALDDKTIYVEARFSEFEGKKIGYVANLGADKVTIKVKNAEGKDVSVKKVEYHKDHDTISEIVLEPYQFMNFDIIE